MARKKPAQRRSPRKTVSASSQKDPVPSSVGIAPFIVVGVGASAGGIEAFTQMLNATPANTGMAFVFVLHMSQHQKSLLSEIVARATPMPVVELTRKTPLRPDHVYVIMPGSELVLEDGALIPSQRQNASHTFKGIDHFFRSLAAHQGHRAIGIVLSGSSSDGTLGLESIKAEGGITFAQDETAQHDFMPRAAAGSVDYVLPPADIGRELARIAGHPYIGTSEAEPAGSISPFDFAGVLDILHQATGVDFSHYKRNTIRRRVSRRLVLQKMENVADYIGLLKENPPEVEALYQDMLIGVTSFFRDEESIEALKSDIFPKIVANHARHEAVRMWTLGCSTGEEAYSLAIAYSEFAEDTNRQHPIQLFATDLNGKGIDKARAGAYPTAISRDLSAERLRRFFVEADGGYRVRKSIRDVCIFARHNVLTEPPFSRVDLISCRNLLIYLGQEMQQRVIPILHYALRPDGYLWLGKSESIGSFRDLFEVVDVRHKIYRKKAVAPRLVLGNISGFRAAPAPGQEHSPDARELPAVDPLDSHKEAERLLLTRYAPASVLINSSGDIVQFRGSTGAFLTPSPGRASLNMMKMLREGLLVPVRNLLNKASKERLPARKPGLRVKTNGEYREVNVEIIPLKGGASGGPHFLVTFEEAEGPERTERVRRERAADEENDRRSRQSKDLKSELAATREYLQSVIEQQEAANEELQSANEEIQSANEELQSINEELETSKEEVQSSNEELATVNDELNHRNSELSRSNNDLVNLLSSVQMAIVMLDSGLRIRRLTPAAEKMLSLIPTDVGRPIRDLNLNISISDLERHLEEVIDTVSVREFEVLDKAGRWQLLRLRPYRTVDNKIDGVVMTFIDIDAIKRSQQTLRHHAELLEQTHEPIVMWEIGGAIIYWNKAAEEVYGYTSAEAVGRRNHELLGTAHSAPSIEETLEKHGRWEGQIEHKRRDGEKIRLASRMSLVREADGRRLVIETNRPL